MTDLVKIARQRVDTERCTHYEGCERDHRECRSKGRSKGRRAARSATRSAARHSCCDTRQHGERQAISPRQSRMVAVRGNDATDNRRRYRRGDEGEVG